MGWFDGDSSGEDEPPSQAVAAGAAADDDPFEAFLETLGGDSSSSKAAPNSQSSHRMDLPHEEDDGDDLVASAWSQQLQQQPVTAEVEEKRETALASTTTTTAPSYRAQQARQALNSTFLPAGSRPQRQQPHDDDERNPHDWQQVGVPQIRPTTTATFAAVRQKFWEPTNTTLGSDWRRTHDVHCSADIDPITSFAPLQAIWTPGLLECLDKQGYTEPTLVQSQTLPVALAGRDVLVTAATGQGKTLAYLWPLVVHVLDQPHLAADETGPIALVLVPTRELAQQVHKQAKLLLAADGGTSKAIIGGQGKYLLFQELKKSGGMEIAVATPGRLLDVLSDRRKRNGTTLDRTTIVVLDEADKMLQMGFETQVRTILKALRPDRQTLLLSATLGRRIESIAREWLQPDYVRIAVGKSGETSEHVDQHVMVLPNVQAKQSFLLQMIPTFQAVGRAIVFVATRDGCESLAKIVHENTQGQSISLATLHGDKHQSHRTSTLRAFTKGDVSILIATDVAGRGLDVPQVATVVNYDPPKNLDTHVHRVGRAGRLSKQGTQQKGSAYTLLTPKDAEFGHVLRNSFAREGREISDDLQELAETSRKSGNIVSRKAGNRGGLGFESVPTAPLAKRSRWH